jgi:hypothetical protein
MRFEIDVSASFRDFSALASISTPPNWWPHRG